MSAYCDSSITETSEVTCVNNEEVKEQLHNISLEIDINNNSIIDDNVTENECSNNNDEDRSVQISTCATDHASTSMKTHNKKRRAGADKANINKKTRPIKGKTTSSSSYSSTRVHNRPIYNIAGVNISALIQDINKLTDGNTNGAGDGSLLYNRKTRRVRRRSSILEDHPAFIAHRQLRENWENEMTNSKLLTSSNKHIAENMQEHIIHKQQKQSQEVKALNTSQSRQHYTELRHLRNAFTAAPFASAVDVLNSLTEWRDSPSLVYAELLWNYAPEAAKKMMAFDVNNLKIKNEKEINVFAPSSTDYSSSNRNMSTVNNAPTIEKNEKDNEDDNESE